MTPADSIIYAYAPDSNRMTSSPSGTVDLDAAGNTLSMNGLTFEYNQAGRMVAARSSGNLLGQYAYSFDNHRAQKTVQGNTTLFHYGANDNLLAETSTAARPSRNTSGMTKSARWRRSSMG